MYMDVGAGPTFFCILNVTVHVYTVVYVYVYVCISSASFPSLPFLLPLRGKMITAGCLSQLSGHFYIGTEGGNVFILDLRKFQLESEIIYWNNATAM